MEREYAIYATDRAVEFLAIDSPTGYTKQAAEWVKNSFEELGFSAKTTTKVGLYQGFNIPRK